LQLQFETRSIEFIDRSGDVLGRGVVKSAVLKVLETFGLVLWNGKYGHKNFNHHQDVEKSPKHPI
jgi:hypothetical protein